MHRHATSEELIPLSVGYPSARLFPVEEISEAVDATLRSEPERALQYSDVQGLPDLAEQIASLSAARGAAEDPNDIVITNGAAQGLTLACRAILRPGDVVACEDPSFPSVIRAVEETGARIVAVPVDDDGLDVDALAALVARQEIKALAVQSRLHNPTGRDLVPARRRRLLDLARRHGFFVLEDSVYGDLRFAGEELPSLRSEAPAHVVYIDSLSKTVGGGLRIGWVAAGGPVLDRIITAKRADDIHSPTLTQLAIARYLASGAYPAHAERARAFYRERLAVLHAAIEDSFGAAASIGAARRRPSVAHPRPAARRTRARRGGGPPRRRLRAGRSGSIERRPDLSMRLSFGYLEPDQLVEGVRRLAAAASSLRRRPTRREAVPI